MVRMMGLLKVENLVVLKADRILMGYLKVGMMEQPKAGSSLMAACLRMAVRLVELIWNLCFYF